MYLLPRPRRTIAPQKRQPAPTGIGPLAPFRPPECCAGIWQKGKKPRARGNFGQEFGIHNTVLNAGVRGTAVPYTDRLTVQYGTAPYWAVDAYVHDRQYGTLLKRDYCLFSEYYTQRVLYSLTTDSRRQASVFR